MSHGTFNIIRHRIKVTDAIQVIIHLKWNWTWHVPEYNATDEQNLLSNGNPDAYRNSGLAILIYQTGYSSAQPGMM